MVRAGLNPNQRDGDGNTPFNYMIISGNPKLAYELLEASNNLELPLLLNITIADHHSMSPLLNAIKYQHTALAEKILTTLVNNNKIFLSRLGYVDKEFIMHITAHYANNIQLVQKIVEIIKPDQKRVYSIDELNLLSVKLALMYNPHVAIVQFFVDEALNNFTVKELIKTNPTEVHYLFLSWAANRNSNPAVLEYLITIFKPTQDTLNQLLSIAARYNPNPAFLIQKGADVNATNQSGISPLMYAAGYNPNPYVSQLLIENGADINAADTISKSTPLIYAAQYNPNKAVIELLINRGADINYLNSFSISPLYVAALNPNSMIVQYILMLDKSRINTTNTKDNSTVLHAIAREKPELIPLFLEKGADKTARLINNQTALDLLRKEHPDKVSLYEKLLKE